MPSPFTIYVIQFAHTDIGYTHPQEQIALMYLEHYDRVLELCRRSAAAPEPERFKWVCETFWQVRHYLTHRPEREEEFLEYVRRGQIEITAGYLHFTDMIDPDAYARSIEFAVEYCRRHNLPLRTALHCDINGWPWAMADLLAANGIPYFASAVHIDNATDPLGKRGSLHYHWLLEQSAIRPDAPVRMPQAFTWRGPEGGQVLHWLGEHYHLGNVLGLSSMQPFGADKTRYFLETDRLTAEQIYAVAEERLPRYIARLQADGYPYDVLTLGTGGFYVDNSPPDGRWCDVIQRWNASHTDIKLRTATLSEWFEALTAQMIGELPVYESAWPDHWAHGLGSATARMGQARRTQRRRAGILALVEQSNSPTAEHALTTALEQERLALEHTFNAWSTTAHPGAPFNDFQQAAKELTFHRAALYQDEALGSALRTLLPVATDTTQLCVWNEPASEGVRVVHFDAGDLRIDPEHQVLAASDGQRYPIQRDQLHPPGFIAALPATAGLARYTIESDPAASGTSNPVPSSATILITGRWQLELDPATGGLRSLRDLAGGREWVDTGSHHSFGQLVHEHVVHPLEREAVGNAARVIALGVATDELKQRFGDGPVVEHTTLAITEAPQLIPGPVYDALLLRGEAARIGRVQIAWRCYHELPLVELVLDWDKRWSDEPETAYVAFPFAAQGSRLLLETSGGFFQPGSHGAGGQLPGTSSSYYTIQRAASIEGDHQENLLWLPLDAPLVMTNALAYNRWETSPYEWNGLLASMPVNHYWHTNFATSQRGPLRLRYRLFAAQNADREAAIRMALPQEVVAWR